MRLHVRHLTHREASTAVLVLFFAFIVLEICAERRVFFSPRDVMTAGAIVLGWFKEFLHIVVERFAEEI